MKQKRGRPIHGILLLNKPVGISSNAALQRVKHLFQAQKAGHTGSLDKLASGLLPLCLGEATKLSSFLLESDKRYLTEFTLGVRTSTGDAEGTILETPPYSPYSLAEIQAALSHFTGCIQQVPPMYSALKYKGQALYRLARQGQTIERAPRTITIYSLQLHHCHDQKLTLEVHCSKGTYIRSLADDFGQRLGCGAHVSALHRLAVGPYTNMLDFSQLENLVAEGPEKLEASLLPMESALPDWPKIILPTESAYYISQGHPVQVPKAPTAGWVKLFNQHHDLLGIGYILEDGRVAPKRLLLPRNSSPSE